VTEVDKYRSLDYLTRFEAEEPEHYNRYLGLVNDKIDSMAAAILREDALPLEEYFTLNEEVEETTKWRALQPIAKRQVELINRFFVDKIKNDDRFVFIGEDVLSPYGGAFKVAKDLSFINPHRVFSTPISEAAIVGISNGLSLNGFKAFAEIMFGDFVTLAMDQIINHASKFHHIFNSR
jgi:2-oxoisovalerate dehydrogenase E1 component